MDNPLLEAHVLPPFKTIRAEHVEPAISQWIEQNLRAIEEVIAKQETTTPSWESLVAPIEELDDKLNKAWSPVSHLNSVTNTPAWREAYHHCLPKLTEYATQVGQNQHLHEAFVALKASPYFSQLTESQQKVVKNTLLDFQLSGVALPIEAQKRFAELSQHLAKLQNQFQDNVMDATDSWSMDLESSTLLKGLPSESLALAKSQAEKAKVDGYRLTLDFPCYFAVMTYVDNREIRQKMHKAYFTRASDLGANPEKWDNTTLMAQIIATRHEMAKLLGFDNYAQRSLAKKMAKTTEQVMMFLHDLAQKVRPFAEKEVAELKAFAQNKFNIDKLEPWDIAYYSEKLRQNTFLFSQEELRPYFPLSKVLAGMFEVVHRLYGINIKESHSAEIWHEDVRFFEVEDSHQKLRGMFYLDLFARNQKRGGAWMDEARVRRRMQDGTLQLPVAYLTCNFRTPIDNMPSLLTHDEVLTLFHEFGHGLHHLLTQIDYAGVSGINGVAWDAVELPSQFMENWCWQKEALYLISGHYQTGEPLSGDYLEKMQQAKNFQSGMALLRQLEFALFDFRIHLEFNPEQGDSIQAILDEVRKQYGVLPAAPYARFQHSFSHIFAGGYAAGYYSYLWAEVLSCDAFALFQETGIFNADTGKLFLETILEKGGSVDADNLFRAFRGRDPEIKAFLSQHGLIE